MNRNIAIYSALCFPPFDDKVFSSYSDYLDHHACFSKSYSLLAFQLSKCFSHSKYVVVTNEPYLLFRIARGIKMPLPTIQYCPFNFLTDIGTPFRLAHYKIDVWGHIGKYCRSTHACLLDLDIVGLPNCYDKLSALLDSSTDFFFYDQFSVQARSYGEDVVSQDLLLLSPDTTSRIWAGGEFLLGKKLAFLDLYAAGYSIRSNYLNQINKLRHVGDEAILTSSLLSLSDRLCIKPVNHAFVVNRIFLARLLKGSKRQSLKDIFGYSLLHLPSSKNFLSHSFYRMLSGPLQIIVLYLYMISSICILRLMPCR